MPAFKFFWNRIEIKAVFWKRFSLFSFFAFFPFMYLLFSFLLFFLKTILSFFHSKRVKKEKKEEKNSLLRETISKFESKKLPFKYTINKLFHSPFLYNSTYPRTHLWGFYVKRNFTQFDFRLSEIPRENFDLFFLLHQQIN